jgi:hypothetical protein
VTITRKQFNGPCVSERSGAFRGASRAARNTLVKRKAHVGETPSSPPKVNAREATAKGGTQGDGLAVVSKCAHTGKLAGLNPAPCSPFQGSSGGVESRHATFGIAEDQAPFRNRRTERNRQRAALRSNMLAGAGEQTRTNVSASINTQSTIASRSSARPAGSLLKALGVLKRMESRHETARDHGKRVAVCPTLAHNRGNQGKAGSTPATSTFNGTHLKSSAGSQRKAGKETARAVTGGGAVPSFLTYDQASAEHFKEAVSVSRLRRAVARKELRAVKLGHRTVLFRPVDLDRWAESFVTEVCV